MLSYIRVAIRSTYFVRELLSHSNQVTKMPPLSFQFAVEIRWPLHIHVHVLVYVFFTLLTDRASTILITSNIRYSMVANPVQYLVTK